MDTPQVDDLIIMLGQISAALIAISGVAAIAYKLFFKKLADKIRKNRSGTSSQWWIKYERCYKQN